MKLNELRDNEAPARAGCASAAASARATARPPAAARRARRAARASSIKGFEGGQMPLHMRLPKRGFNNIFAKDYAEVNLGAIQKLIDAGKLDAKGTLDHDALKAAGLAAAARTASACSARANSRPSQLQGRRRVEGRARGGREGRRIGRADRAQEPGRAGRCQEGQGPRGAARRQGRRTPPRPKGS